jgi:hypothetical protein
MSGGRVSPHNSLGAATHTIAPSPLGSRQSSLSPVENHAIPGGADYQKSISVTAIKNNGTHQLLPPNKASDIPRDFPHDIRREQIAAGIGGF